MRHLAGPAALILVACGGEATRTTHAPRTPVQSATPHAEVASPSANPAAPAPSAAPAVEQTPPPFAGLASDQTFFIVEVERGKARCQPWTYAAAARTLATTRGAVTDTFQLQVKDTALELTGLARKGGGVDASTSCGRSFALANAPHGIVVDRAPWFTDAAACETAVRERRRVAMNFDCELPEEVSERVATASRARFHRLLARGGTAYSIIEGRRGNTCKAVRVRPHRGDKNAPLEGAFRWAVVSDEGLKGTSELGYQLWPESADEAVEGLDAGVEMISLLGPSTTWSDGSGHGFGCGRQQPVEYGEDHVMLQEALYFTQKACRTAIAEEAARMAWYPREDDGAVADAPSIEGELALGGC